MSNKNILECIQKDCGLPPDIANAIAKKKQIAYKRGYKDAIKKVFDKFDEYACIKDDTWYKELKEHETGGK